MSTNEGTPIDPDRPSLPSSGSAPGTEPPPEFFKLGGAAPNQPPATSIPHTSRDGRTGQQPARPSHGRMVIGVITLLIGVPLFLIWLVRMVSGMLGPDSESAAYALGYHLVPVLLGAILIWFGATRFSTKKKRRRT